MLVLFKKSKYINFRIGITDGKSFLVSKMKRDIAPEKKNNKA